ncbi:hypothetical protein GGR50DRAFT_703066 [Xylaria sp. CBS 124048]|nr:hypothetical protein GGR50DRAFT_703066 [Xylaria sp. CBS 124048]
MDSESRVTNGESVSMVDQSTRLSKHRGTYVQNVPGKPVSIELQRAFVNSAHFVVGVETEAPLIVIKDEQVLENGQALIELARLFNNNELPAYADALDINPDHEMWAISIDSSIEVGRNLQGRGSPIEIKSPALKTGKVDYKELFRKMWRIIEPKKVAHIEYWKMANNNIHFSLEGRERFPLAWAQRLAFCIVYFERAIDSIIPGMTHTTDTTRPGGWKHCNRYTKRNRVVPRIVGKPMDDLHSCWAWIRRVESIEELHDLICHDNDEWRRTNGLTHKNWKWNFKGLNWRTIEFRHMPPTRNAQESIDWIDFTTEFVRAAGRVDSGRLDAAHDGKMTFREALDLPVVHTTDTTQRSELIWAGDHNLWEADWLELLQFMGNQEFWARLLVVRNKLEMELEKLG